MEVAILLTICQAKYIVMLKTEEVKSKVLIPGINE